LNRIFSSRLLLHCYTLHRDQNCISTGCVCNILILITGWTVVQAKC